jgi:cytochrome c oxidase assembly protein subunit 15
MSLVDWDPAIQMALTGAVLAALPLCWVALRLWQQGGVAAWRTPVAWRAALTATTLLLVVDLVVFGAFTRLTDSGLGCPDWPGCYGSASPLGAHELIAQAQAQAPHGPVTHTKAWIEMIHRYLATMVGVLIVVLMGLSWWLKARDKSGQIGHRVSPWWATGAFVWVCLQGAFGAFTVTLKLYPLVVSMHLLGGLVGVTILAAQMRHLTRARVGDIWGNLPPNLQRMALWVWCLWMVQAALGAWVSTNGAVLVCADFPQCQGQWWPQMDWPQGFALLRHLGVDENGGAISLPALTAIHMAHRLGALVVMVAVGGLAWRTWQAGYAGVAGVLVTLLLWQLVAGLSNVVLGWPMLAALAHTLGAALMVAYLMRMVCPASETDAFSISKKHLT